MSDVQRHRKVLAEILTSKRIGVIHARLVGEVIVAEARLDQWVLEHKERIAPIEVSLDINMTERVLDCEERYVAAWEDLKAADTISVPDDRLRRLKEALQDTVVAYDRFREELERVFRERA